MGQSPRANLLRYGIGQRDCRKSWCDIQCTVVVVPKPCLRFHEHRFSAVGDNLVMTDFAYDLVNQIYSDKAMDDRCRLCKLGFPGE